MGEEIIQRDLIKSPEKIGFWNYCNIGSTSLNALKGAGIIPDRDYEEFELKKPDGLIAKKPLVIAAIEYKQPKDLRSPSQIANAISQELGTARALGAKIYIVTDGQKTLWINPLTGNHIKLEDGSNANLQFNKSSPECVKFINKAIESINSSNDVIRPSKIVDPLPLAQKIWQDLWSVSGATPENCLYSFVELFIFKYLSDLGVLTGLHSFKHLLKQYDVNTENEVIEYYASTVRVKIKDLFPGSIKDKTTIINGTIFVSKDDKAVSGYATVFRKILKRLDDFGPLENIDYDFKSKLFETFLKESISKKNWGQFFTPLKVVRAIVGMAELKVGMKVCDPACGVGKFLLEPILLNQRRFFKVENGQLKPQITLRGFDKGFDKDEQKTIILAKANMLIHLSGMVRDYPDLTKQFAQLFNDTFLLQTNSILGTLSNPATEEYDLILSNPPYVMSGSSNLKDEISKDESLKNHFAISGMGIEGLFVEWIVRALKSSGKAFVIVPDGIMNRLNDKRLRDFILEECFLDAVISLPLNTFFTTNKKTYIVALTKKERTEAWEEPKERQSYPVFTYLCSEIGETRDMYRFDMEQNDMDAASALFNMFKGSKNHFSTSDKRCKLVAIDTFYTSTNWSIERWWTSEEKIELGIEEEIDSVSIEEYASLIGDAANSLLKHKDELLSFFQKKNTNLTYKRISITDPNYFDVLSSFYLNKTNTALENFPNGSLPVFSAAKGPIAYIGMQSTPPVAADEANPVLSFANDGDGSAGRNFILHTKPFYARGKRFAFKAKDARIVMPYIWSQLSDMREKHNFSRTYLANRTNLSKVTVDVPVDENGCFDVDAQNIAAEQFYLVNELKRKIEEMRFEIKRLRVSLDLSPYSITFANLANVLDCAKGKSKYTRKYGDAHKGPYPVFSASTNTPLTSIDSFDYNGQYLSWSTNGFAGTVKILDGQFSINGDRGIFIPKLKEIDLLYLKYTLEPILRKLAKGRIGERGEAEFTKVYPSMLKDILIPFPVDSSGEISLEAQQDIAESCGYIEQIKSRILVDLNCLNAHHTLFLPDTYNIV
jgi:type I restriction-modification system DNA methylase subunit